MTLQVDVPVGPWLMRWGSGWLSDAAERGESMWKQETDSATWSKLAQEVFLRVELDGLLSRWSHSADGAWKSQMAKCFQLLGHLINCFVLRTDHCRPWAKIQHRPEDKNMNTVREWLVGAIHARCSGKGWKDGSGRGGKCFWIEWIGRIISITSHTQEAWENHNTFAWRVNSICEGKAEWVPAIMTEKQKGEGIWVIFTERLAFVFRNIRVLPVLGECIEPIMTQSRWEPVPFKKWFLCSGNDILMAISLKRTYLWKQKEKKKTAGATRSSQACTIEIEGLLGNRQ